MASAELRDVLDRIPCTYRSLDIFCSSPLKLGMVPRDSFNFKLAVSFTGVAFVIPRRATKWK